MPTANIFQALVNGDYELIDWYPQLSLTSLNVAKFDMKFPQKYVFMIN